MRENVARREGEEKQIEGRDFLKAKEEMINFLRHELRRAQNFGVFDEQSKEIRQQRIDYLDGVIDSLKNGHLSPAREFFGKLIAEKEQVVAQIAGDLRKAIATAKPKVDKLNKESARFLKQLEIEKDKGDMKRVQAILKEIGNIDDAIGDVAGRQEEIRQNLKKAQDDSDLEKFRRFVGTIDGELAKSIIEG
jgi:phage-related protein